MAKPADDVRKRLEDAALELFGAHGYERVTAAQIAAHAGVTERTFFRHFSDKREVLFGNETLVRATLLDAIGEAPGDLEPLDVLLHAFLAFAPMLEARSSYAIPRYKLVAATSALQERELSKTAAMIGALSSALQARGVPELRSRLAAQAGMAAFVLASTSWMDDPTGGLSGRITTVFAELAMLFEAAGQAVLPKAPEYQPASGRPRR